MSRFWRVLAATLITGLLSVFLTAGSAAAAPLVDDPCLNNPAVLCAPPNPAQSELLPVNRWADATGGMHGRLGTFDIGEKIQRYGTYPVLMSMGNAMWSGATSMTSAAIRMDILDSAGQSADNAAAKLGQALMSSGVVALVAVIALLVPVWRAARGQGGAPWGQLGKIGAIVGLFSVMLVGAGASTTQNGEFKPGMFSPGWWVVTTNSVIASVASAPAAALTVGDAGAGFNYDEASKGELSCYQYVEYLKGRYQTSNPANRMESSVPLVMSGMWEATGLQVWSTSQFGPNNPYGDFTYCRMLEQFSGTSAAEQRSITLAASGDPVAEASVSNLKSLAWETSENNQRDRTMVAWAVCRPNGSGGWRVAEGWGSIKGTYREGDGQVAGDCEEWWENAGSFHNDAGTTFDDESSAFEFKSSDVVYNDVPDTRARNYLLTLQGHTGGGVTSSLAMVYAYVFSSLVMLVVFGVMALGIIIAKVAALVMMIAVFFALLMALWPNGSRGGIGKYLGQYVGMAVFVFGIQLIFAFMTLLTSMMVQAGADMFGGGHFITMLWTGFAPVVSVFVLHMVFTKFLKLPSPFSVTGAQQWGQAAASGAVGGAVGAGVMNRLQSRGTSAALHSGRVAGRAAGRAVAYRVSGGKLGVAGARGAGRQGALVPVATSAAAGSAAGTVAPLKGRKVATAAAAGAGVPTQASNGVRRSDAVAVSGSVVKGRHVGPTPEERAAAKAVANAAAMERGARNTARGRYAEGVKARWGDIHSQFAGRPVKEKLGAAARLGTGSAAKAAGAGALLVATGGLAVPVMAGVWGKNHLSRVRAARGGAIDRFEAKKAADELAAEQAKRKAEKESRERGTAPRPGVLGPDRGATSPASASAAGAATRPSSRGNGETVNVPVRTSVIRRDPAAGARPAQAGLAVPREPVPVAVGPRPERPTETTAPIPVARRAARDLRRGEKPFGRGK